MKYKVMVMAFDGETKIERPEFDTTDDALYYAGMLGSKWFFYPFEFIITETEKTVVIAPHNLGFLVGKRVKTVQRMFKKVSDDPEMEGADPDEFILTFIVKYDPNLKREAM